MAPKKEKIKELKKEQVPETASLYSRRQPLPAPEPVDAAEIEGAWKASRNAFVLPLPEWDDEAVNTTEWNPNDTETLYTNTAFSAKLLPKAIGQSITAWKRAHAATNPTASEEAEPQAQPLPDTEEAPVEKPDPKAKAKAKPGKGAVAPEGDFSSRQTTAQQFLECTYEGDVCVVSMAEFKTRDLLLTNDDAMPPLCQSIASQFAVIAEHRGLLPRGSFLWELIHPQDEQGRPLFNPHGKYVVRLFVQGCWRQVLIDDIVPVGLAGAAQPGYAPGSHAQILPASSAPNVLWPQLLAKAVLRAFQADLRGPALQAVTALTGWLPFQLPLNWEALQSSHGSRAFCCLSTASMVDLEARQREAFLAANAQVDLAGRGKTSGGPGAPGVSGVSGPAVPALNLPAGGSQPAVPKLGAQPNEALLQFLICELEDEPRQVRLKAAAWRPAGSTPRKAVIRDVESEAEYEDEEAQRRTSEEVEESEHEDQDIEDEDEDRSGRRSPSGGEATVQSARSKDEGSGAVGAGVEGGDGAPGVESFDGVEEELANAAPWVNPWPENPPMPLLLKSVIQEHLSQLSGGFWLAFDVLAEACNSFVSYIPPGHRNVASACLNTCWANGRRQAYCPSPNRLLRLRLVPMEAPQPPQQHRRWLDSPGGNGEEAPPSRGAPWHRVLFLYEPLRLDPLFGGPSVLETAAGCGGADSNCILQCVNSWQPAPPCEGAPESIYFSVGDDPLGNDGSATASRSVLLPPGEHWFLVLDDAMRAGSALSVYAEGSHLNMAESRIEFLEPASAFEQKGMAVITLEPTLYAAQKGFSIWAKAELTLSREAAAEAPFLRLFSFLSDPALRPYLQLTFLQLTEDEAAEPGAHCASWSVRTLMRSPLLRLMSLPLARPTDRSTTAGSRAAKYIVMLEANLPSAVRSGNFLLQLMLPRSQGCSSQMSPDDQEDAAPLRATALKADQVFRWSGETTPNDKGMVLCERLTVPVGSGDVTASLSVQVSGLPKTFLRATLVAQLPAKEEMRPRGEDGAPPEPFLPGVPIDPREFGGRRNWLDSCKTVVEECGVEKVLLPHTLLCEGSTYLLYVHIDPHRGPDNLDSGQWLLELFGSGEVEVGADTMEQDLKVLVRRSWVDPAQETTLAPRHERAAASRQRWLRQREADGSSVPASAHAAGPGAGIAAEGERTPAGSLAEASGLAAALEREGRVEHANDTMAEFVRLHTVVEPVLVVEDPFTIAPDPPQGAAVAAEAGGATAVATEVVTVTGDADPAGVASQALGMLGLQGVRQAEIAIAAARWEQAHKDMEVAKERNAEAVAVLKQWCDEHAVNELKFLPEREMLRSALEIRFQMRSALKDVVSDPEKVDLNVLRGALDTAVQAEVDTWDAALIEMGENKLRFVEAAGALTVALAKVEEEPLTDPSVREEFARLLSTVQALRKELQAKGVPLPAGMCDREQLDRAAELLRESEGGTSEAAGHSTTAA